MKLPENDRYFQWTSHIKGKMVFYRLSSQIIKTVLKNPARKEEGIAPGTIAIMKRNDTAKRKEEIWVMYKIAQSAKVKVQNDKSPHSVILGLDPRIQSTKKNKKSKKLDGIETTLMLKQLLVPEKRTMISAWRYPGVTKPGDPIPIPDEIAVELLSDN